MKISINKFIASSGVTSRRGADKLIEDGKVLLNGRKAKATDKVDESDSIIIDGKKLVPEEKIYFIFNKPVGVITTTDKTSPNNIMNYIKTDKRVFPVGRLDVNTSGLILLTNDGELTQKILKSKKVEKEYEVGVDKEISDNNLQKLASGTIKIDGYPVLPAKVKRISERSFSITIVEGRKRQIRRMVEKVKLNVIKLKRIRIGKIILHNLQEGDYKEIMAPDIKSLLEL